MASRWLPHGTSSSSHFQGFEPFKIKLSEAVGANKRQHLKDGPVVILTCTYDGKPVVDAVDFYNDLIDLKEQGWQGITYAVFGSGANVFEATYQLVPKKIDKLIVERGGQRFLELGEGDVGFSCTIPGKNGAKECGTQHDA
ncbi:hypothetical protein B0H14DRAFT_3435387 [Mycena olivaceomarginata]|nr:hypothetical protein B0H14DRAFT_3435387 [Mycena olivaceomarginata]